jgi:hypothetical protein
MLTLLRQFHFHVGVRVAIRASSAWSFGGVLPIAAISFLLPAWGRSRVSQSVDGWTRHLPVSDGANLLGMWLALMTVQLHLERAHRQLPPDRTVARRCRGANAVDRYVGLSVKEVPCAQCSKCGEIRFPDLTQRTGIGSLAEGVKYFLIDEKPVELVGGEILWI